MEAYKIITGMKAEQDNTTGSLTYVKIQIIPETEGISAKKFFIARVVELWNGLEDNIA